MLDGVWDADGGDGIERVVIAVDGESLGRLVGGGGGGGVQHRPDVEVADGESQMAVVVRTVPAGGHDDENGEKKGFTVGKNRKKSPRIYPRNTPIW